MEYVSVRGVEIPALGLGTWPMEGAECKQAVKTGLELGYRHVDTAQMYDNERAVGAAVRESDVDREDVFLTTKLLRENLGHEDVLTSFRGCLTRLDTEYVDLLAFCIDNDVALTAYSPLAKGKVANDDTLREIGERYGKTPAQVALRWLLQQEMVVAIPKASSREHLRENVDVFDFRLTDAETERIFELQGGLLLRLRDKLGF